MNLGQMIGEVQSWCPDAPVTQIRNWLNNAYRDICDWRLWAGLIVKGQIFVPSVYVDGSVTVVTGSTTVIGTGTAFTPDMVGRQFRQGFTSGWYNITSVVSPDQLTLDLPWAGQSFSGSGYQIMSAIVELGPNIKMVLEAVNQWQGYRLITNQPQAVLNRYDTWRVTTGWTFLIAPREFSPRTGNQLFELYPAPTYQQSFPFLAYIQPPNLVEDSDFVYPFIRTDLLVKLAIAQALRWRGPKQNRFYDPASSDWKLREALAGVARMDQMDDGNYPKDLQWDYSHWPFSQHGALWMQSHAEDAWP
jgi:hypothetical protein